MNLVYKPDFEESMKRVDAWFAHEVLDRAPVRFAEHNAEHNKKKGVTKTWPTLRDRWFDAEYQVESFLADLPHQQFLGETFPIFNPNLGPGVFAAMFGMELEYGEVTSWAQHCVHDWSDLKKLKFDTNSPYYTKIEELTQLALKKCAGKSLVGYTDLHGSVDCVVDWRNPQELCMDLVDFPDEVKAATAMADAEFLKLYDHYDAVLKKGGQKYSVNWMGIPAKGKMAVPSCDFISMVSQDGFDEFYLPSLLKEVRHCSHNIFHADGKGFVRHLDRLLGIPEIQAIQWVQGVGDDRPIMQWLPVIKKIQAAGKSVIVDLFPNELEDFIKSTSPKGVYLWIAATPEEQPAILKRLEKWK